MQKAKSSNSSGTDAVSAAERKLGRSMHRARGQSINRKENLNKVTGYMLFLKNASRNVQQNTAFLANISVV